MAAASLKSVTLSQNKVILIPAKKQVPSIKILAGSNTPKESTNGVKPPQPTTKSDKQDPSEINNNKSNNQQPRLRVSLGNPQVNLQIQDALSKETNEREEENG